MDLSILFDIGIFLIFIGIILLFVGMIREASKSSNRDQKTQVGGVIFIGPIPIVFGSSKGIAKWMLIVAVILFILMVIFYIL
ncbi:MAG: DUF131 domain-containing protein [Saccharolobus sp.]|uniref:Integral membrane protein n=2 Tax=Saccharolobus shibatae TaxID=2286 RepID=A0A8F5GST4_SACSH|nr:DUF131 domain-containing protein [Saccharolobus shibatae]MCH4815405.1 DUF131 domain-containing protein [Saccharolobus shibatae]QXJ28214.1 putative integral membrane protein [Saccharolobus shibatae B12]QXJ31544.1 putative integral membrane protein [Saccharolobus shibatae]QXJ34561.1 putative integral membrane protein [Saccharolobus shibatae]